MLWIAGVRERTTLSECGQLLTAEHRLIGDRKNAYEEICADSTGAAFSERMRSRIFLPPDRTRTSAAGTFNTKRRSK